MGDFSVNAVERPPRGRVRRCLGRTAVAASAGLLVGVAAMWAGSCRRHPGLHVSVGRWNALIGSVRGHLAWLTCAGSGEPPQWPPVSLGDFFDDHWDSLLDPTLADVIGLPASDAVWMYERPWHHPLGSVAHRAWLGFQTEVPAPPLRSGFERDVVVHDWFLAAVCGVLPTRA